MSGVLCNKRISLKLKFYKTVLRQDIMYCSECWAIDKRIEQRMSVAKMRMLKWISGMTSEDRKRNKHIRKSIGAASIMIKMRENRLRWFDRDMRGEESVAVRTVIEMYVEGRRDRIRPKNRWMEIIECDMWKADVSVFFYK
ncbi:uncharacterized protein LOC126896662 [Daktulosphaira vitifoliae]|uniref:uncharacterized protein LOC126896662 n=1 Tax=Daktulosphaira vitifoliae TaxID=58002 RepID=UPI0021A9F635|nr:uncharacterized protein LOC126896662 [Daktulosphaira vitifoliae]